MIFDIVFHMHTRSHSCQKRELKNRPAGRTQDGSSVLQDLHCRANSFVSCPAPCKAGRLSKNVLQDAGQDEKNRPATFSDSYSMTTNYHFCSYASDKSLTSKLVLNPTRRPLGLASQSDR
jgi:hypothetical protein